MITPLSLTGRRWNLRNVEPIADIVAHLQRERGLLEDVAGKLSDPFLFPEMSKAVQRINRAIAQRETIGIFGDYDADGITGTAQLVRLFRRRDIEPVVHLPHRAKEGYGMKKTSIDAMKAKGVTLLITVDTGISAHAEIEHASSLGIDTIVTDHHTVHGGRPPALAVIHPLLPGPFPNPHLCGSGVAFMLVRALEEAKMWEGIDIDVALAAIGTIGDLVPLIGENRTLVIHGLRFLTDLAPSPLRDLVDSVKGTGPLTAGDIAFRVVPRINAAGRMAHPEIALRAILEGGAALQELHRLNDERRSFVDELDAALKDTASATDLFTMIISPDITPGTAGLLASRFTERTGRPSLVAANMGEVSVASIRSPEGVNVMKCLAAPSVRDILLSFGGHAQAAGCSFRSADAERLREALQRSLDSCGVNADALCPTIVIDAELSSSSATLHLAKRLGSLEPFGSGNEEPVFLLPNQTLTHLRAVGSDASHLQCRVGDVKAIGFRLGSLIDQLGTSHSYDIAATVGVNEWNGKETVQLTIEDIRCAN